MTKINALAGSAGHRENGHVADEVRSVRNDWLAEWMPKLTSDEVPINPYRVIWDLMNTIDRKKLRRDP